MNSGGLNSTAHLDDGLKITYHKSIIVSSSGVASTTEKSKDDEGLDQRHEDISTTHKPTPLDYSRTFLSASKVK